MPDISEVLDEKSLMAMSRFHPNEVGNTYFEFSPGNNNYSLTYSLYDENDRVINSTTLTTQINANDWLNSMVEEINKENEELENADQVSTETETTAIVSHEATVRLSSTSFDTFGENVTNELLK
ncbi:predicted protein [Scheffersomyces stipitis CBS 6054]|uniref:Uncharacterized protein n=1 Tax=Scheffersomyces stipitis (strain ATCC 58785 / CBS 6054 / NBRC 10063 / NRRL Y-11545) TaxID=322104 RepID=A3LSZ5_PICST|nr:predicted protein [Scheffersomyces stipitis CBS 6054]ABN66319.1 predicted protein [Scheffersomyces stipitis CBS 6054]